MDPKEKIILALDVEHYEEAQRLVTEFSEYVGMFKVGKQLFTHCGPKIVDYIKMKDSKVFLDLKYHDIPNTVSKAAVEATKLGVDMLNVHALGGLAMMEETRNAIHSAAKTLQVQRPKVIGVTVLTSIDDQELQRMGIETPVSVLVKRLTLLVREAGLDGAVAGGEDIEMIRELCGKDFVIVTPGVRIDEAKDDQKRTISPLEAIRKGATYLVLGRAVRKSPDPVKLLERICDDIEHADSLG
jgi:orotidine-5'-phosphate decarboxylase